MSDKTCEPLNQLPNIPGTTKWKTKLREYVKKEIGNLSHSEFCEVFNIIRHSTNKYTENKNGVFINLKYLDDDTIIKIKDFIEFSKANKANLLREITDNKNNKVDINGNTTNQFSMDKEFIQNELNRLKIMNNDHFSFQSFLDKLSFSNHKEFPQSEKVQNYPILKTSKMKLEGVKGRLFKKCREINRFTNDLDNLVSFSEDFNKWDESQSKCNDENEEDIDKIEDEEYDQDENIYLSDTENERSDDDIDSVFELNTNEI